MTTNNVILLSNLKTDDPYLHWPLVKPLISIEYAQNNSYSFMQIAEYYTKEENAFLDEVINVSERIVTLPFDKDHTREFQEGTPCDIEQKATKLLEFAINSPQGHAMKLLIHVCSLPNRKKQVYSFINKNQSSFPECIKTIPFHYMYAKGPFDENMYFPLMKQLLNGLGPEALVIRGDAIQWCFYHRNEIVKEYIDRIEVNKTSHQILCQIYFYGLSSEINQEECEKRLETVLANEDETTIAKIVEISLKSFSRQELCEYSKKYLVRYASDSRDAVADSYCWYSNSLPVEAFDFYCREYRKMSTIFLTN